MPRRRSPLSCSISWVCIARLRYRMDERDAGRSTRPQQLVVAIAVGRRLDAEPQGIGHLKHWRSLRLGAAMKQVHDVRTAGDLFLQGCGAGLGDRLQSIEG